MEPSIFTKIIRGDIPCHKIYEDEQTFAFLDIHPAQPGHTLVVPKIQVDRLEQLDDATYAALMRTVKKVMQRMAEIFEPDRRPCIKTEGFDVPHAHIHVIPCRNAADFWAKQRTDQKPDHQVLAAMAQKLQF